MRECGIAGQVTLTQEDFARLERTWSSLAKISLPVPLSPCKRTGTVDSAVRSSFCRARAIIADCPKITFIGGRSRISTNSVVRDGAIHFPVWEVLLALLYAILGPYQASSLAQSQAQCGTGSFRRQSRSE